jgi:hypothetical protein
VRAIPNALNDPGQLAGSLQRAGDPILSRNSVSAPIASFSCFRSIAPVIALALSAAEEMGESL